MISLLKRGNVQKSLFTACAVIPAVIFSFFSASEAVLLDKIVAVVNKEVITWGELYRAMEFEATTEMKALSESDKRRLFRENESVFLENMINRKLQLQAARRLDIGVSNDEINEAVEGIKRKYGMSDADFQETVRKEGFTLNEYKKRLAEQIILTKVVGQQVRNKIVVTDQEAREYVSQNPVSGYRVRQIFFRKPENDPDRDLVEAKLMEVQRRLAAGDDFSLLAQQFSQDPSARNGGDLGFIKKSDLGVEFVAVVTNLTVGAVSSPFWTAAGLHIIKLDEKIDARTNEEMTEIAKRRLFEKRFSEDYKNWIRGLREKAYVEVRL